MNTALLRHLNTFCRVLMRVQKSTTKYGNEHEAIAVYHMMQVRGCRHATVLRPAPGGSHSVAGG